MLNRFLFTCIIFFLSFLTSSCLHPKLVSSLEEAEKFSSYQGRLIEIKPQQFWELMEDHSKLTKPMILEISADWCKACKMLEPKLAELAKAYPTKFTFSILNTSRYPKAMGSKKLRAYPKMIYFFPGMKRFESFGANPKLLKNIVEKYPLKEEKFAMKSNENSIKKHFIIGGATDITTFGNEVLYHKKLLEISKAKISDVACYFNQPEFSQKYLDEKDYNFLKKYSKNCFAAEKKQFLSDITQSLANGQDYIYLYFSSHGNRALKDSKCSLHSKFRLSLAGQIEDCQESNYLFPDELYQVLKSKPKSTKVFLVLQGCYSGGFLTDQMKSLPNTTIITASRADRTSFGCSSSNKYTYFGSSYLKEVKKQKDSLSNWDWKELFERVSKAVEQKESRAKIPKDKRSVPQFFTGK